MSVKDVCELLGGLTRLGAGLSASGNGLARALELPGLAKSFALQADRVGECTSDEREAVSGAVRAAAAAVDAWQAAAPQVLLAAQSLAACDILCGCSTLALRLKLGSTFCKQLCRSIVKQLAFGRAALVRSGESGSASAEAGLDTLVAELVQAQARAVCWATGLAWERATPQLNALLPPAAVVGWLRDAVPLLARLHGSPEAGRAVALVAEAVSCLSAGAVGDQSAFPSALKKDKRLCCSLVDVLLSRVHLAAAAAQAGPPPHSYSWRDAATPAQAAVSEGLRPALQQQLDGTSGMTILESAAQLMLRAPPNLGSPSHSAIDVTHWHLAVAQLLNAACIAQLIQQQPSKQPSEQAVQLLLQLPAKFSPVLQLAIQAAAPRPLAELCIAWSNLVECLALRCDAIRDAGRPALAGGESAAALAAIAAAAGQQSSGWCAATTALVRLIPQLNEAEQLLERAQANGVTLPVATRIMGPGLRGDLRSDLLEIASVAFGEIAAQVEMAAAAGSSRSLAAALPAAWELSTCACQHACWAAACGNNRSILPFMLLNLSSDVVKAAVAAQRFVPPPSGPAASDTLEQHTGAVQAIALAHVWTVQSLSVHLGPQLLLHPMSPATLSCSLCVAAACLSPAHLLAGSQWRSLLHSAVAAVPEVRRIAAEEYMDILGSSLHFRAAPLVAVLAADGLLAGMLRSTDSYLADQRDALVLKAAEAIALLCNAGLQLAETSSTSAECSDGSSGAGASGGADGSAELLLGTIGQHASTLQAAFQDAGLGELLQGQQPSTPVQPTTALRLCASSLRLAAALLEWWQRPEQAAASQLALAQIAADRSCAYLGCDNLVHGLGPAAVKGEGRLKCSKCLVAQYCSTACSHADWRTGGHRRVCNALRAARDAEKAQAAAAAAAAGGGGNAS